MLIIIYNAHLHCDIVILKIKYKETKRKATGGSSEKHFKPTTLGKMFFETLSSS